MKIYLDNNHSSIMDEQTKDTMLPLMMEHYSDSTARPALEQAEQKIRAGIHARDEGSISIGISSDELQSRLLMSCYLGLVITGQKNQIILCACESDAVLDTAKYITSQGCRVSILPLNSDGVVDISMLPSIITPKTAIVSIPMVDPQSGAINPVDEASQICKEHGVPLHTDATHAIGKLPIDVQMMNLDYLTLSTHTMHGPSDIAMLYAKEGSELPNLIQPSHAKATLAGMGKAIELAVDAQAFEMEDVREMRDELEDAIRQIPDSLVVTSWALRTPNVLLAGFKDVHGDALAWELGRYGISVSSEQGRSIIDNISAHRAYRHTLVSFALSRYNTQEEIGYVIEKLKNSVKTIREERAN